MSELTFPHIDLPKQASTRNISYFKRPSFNRSKSQHGFNMEITHNNHSTNSPITFSPYLPQDGFLTPDRSEASFIINLPKYPDVLDESTVVRDQDKVTPKAINNFDEEEMDEFCESMSGSFINRSTFDKVVTPSLAKKSMSDIAARLDFQTKAHHASSFIVKASPSTPDKDKRDESKDMSIKKPHLGTIGRGYSDSRLKRSKDAQWKSQGGDRSFVFRKLFAKPEDILQKNFEEYQRRDKQILMNHEILGNILSFLDCKDTIRMSGVLQTYRKDKEYKKLFQKRLYELFSKGLNKENQIFFWSSHINFRQLKNDHPFAFSQHFAKRCRYFEDIKKDLDRTLPEHDKFSTEEGKQALFSVLVAVSNTIKEMGYIQGLNSVAGVFLFYLKEEQSFWITLYFLEKLKFKELLKEDFNRINILNYQLQSHLDHYIPTLANYFREKDMTLSYYTTSWFLTMFSYHLSVPNVVKVWNFLFTKGLSFLVQFALAIFSKFKDVIIAMDIDEVGPFLKTEMMNISEDDASIFELALSFKINNRLLHELESHYERGENSLLNIDMKGKKQWVSGGSGTRNTLDERIPSNNHRRNISKNDFGQESPLTRSQTTGKAIHNLFSSFTGDISGTIKSIFRKKDFNQPRSNDNSPSNYSPMSLTNRFEDMNSDSDISFDKHSFLDSDDKQSKSHTMLNLSKFALLRRKSRTVWNLGEAHSPTRARRLTKEVELPNTAILGSDIMLSDNNLQFENARKELRLPSIANIQGQFSDNYSGTLNSMESPDQEQRPKTARDGYLSQRSNKEDLYQITEASVLSQSKSYITLPFQTQGGSKGDSRVSLNSPY